MTLKIISPSEILFEGEAEAVTLPGSEGQFTVLRNHASIISVLTKGGIRYRKPDGHEELLEIKGGLVDVDSNVVSVCIY